MSHQRAMLNLDEALKAIDRMLQEANKNPNRPVEIAICDDQGELIAFARMDGCAPQPPIVARKKAYTAARARADTKAYAERLKGMGRSATEFDYSNLLAIQGGVVIYQPRGREYSRRDWFSAGSRRKRMKAIARIGLDVIAGH
jgi:uncharacterized protein GlcG (DUF336 family)